MKRGLWHIPEYDEVFECLSDTQIYVEGSKTRLWPCLFRDEGYSVFLSQGTKKLFDNAIFIGEV